MTPKMTPHAVQRCQEMGISTKVAKHIVQDPVRLVYPSPPEHAGDRVMVRSKVHPQYLVIVDPGDPEHGIPDAVVTVLWHSPEERLSREEGNRLAKAVLA